MDTNQTAVQLECARFEWIGGPEDDPTDQCAHGRVALAVGDHVLLAPSDGEWTVSAAALYLLRSLDHDHLEGRSVADGNYLFPCCGFTALAGVGDFDVVLFGCPNGKDVWIKHLLGEVVLTADDVSVVVPAREWRKAVVGFAESLTAFYARSAPKARLEDKEDRAGWAAFWQEFDSRLSAARHPEI